MTEVIKGRLRKGVAQSIVWAVILGTFFVVFPKAEKLQMLDAAQNQAEVGRWAYNASTDQLVWDAAMFRLYGVSERTWTPDFEGFSRTLHPDDASRIQELCRQAIDQGTDYYAVFRVVGEDGHERYIRASGGVDGKVFAGICMPANEMDYRSDTAALSSEDARMEETIGDLLAALDDLGGAIDRLGSRLERAEEQARVASATSQQALTEIRALREAQTQPSHPFRKLFSPKN